MESQIKPKVTARFEYDRSRPTSPFKSRATTLSPPHLIKPKAKVNSSANITTRKINVARGTSPVSATRSSGIPAPRAPSPFKQVHTGPTLTSSASGGVKARLTPRTVNPHSAPVASETRQRSLTTVPSDSALSARVRHRRGSVSSHGSHVVSPTHSEVHARALSRAGASPTEENGSPVSNAGRGMVRVKSKVSKVAETSPQVASSVSSSPSLPSTTGNGHGRVPSIPHISVAAPLLPANVNTSPTTTTAHHHRFATTRESPTQRSHAFQPFPSSDDLTVNYGAYSVVAKVDPTAIPLPPQSPPMSTISFSSRSSASRSSLSYDTHGSDMSRSTAPTLHSRVNEEAQVRHGDRVPHARSSLEGLGVRTQSMPMEPSSPSDESSNDDGEADHSYESDDDEEDDLDRKLKDEAKSNRKIEDLEISNRSLLAINISLEAAKHRQAKEIRDLKRKLRESRLILPPPTFRAVKSSLPQEEIVEDEDPEEDEDEQALLEGKDDEPYRRVKAMMEGLLESCRRALETKPQDFVEGCKGGAKVLSAEEVRNWRGDDADADTRSTTDADRDEVLSQTGVEEGFGDRPQPPTTSSGINGLASEEEVEASLFRSDDALSTLPPIRITPSP